MCRLAHQKRSVAGAGRGRFPSHLQFTGFIEVMKINIRKSTIKRARQHGFRAKPSSYIRNNKQKVKRLRVLARLRRKRRLNSNK